MSCTVVARRGAQTDLRESGRARLRPSPVLTRLARRLALARCKVGVDWVEVSSAKGASLLRTSGLLFPPL
jgi:hypothetical protein